MAREKRRKKLYMEGYVSVNFLGVLWIKNEKTFGTG